MSKRNSAIQLYLEAALKALRKEATGDKKNQNKVRVELHRVKP